MQEAGFCNVTSFAQTDYCYCWESSPVIITVSFFAGTASQRVEMKSARKTEKHNSRLFLASDMMCTSGGEGGGEG